MTKEIMRGVQDIRTFSGRANEGSISYKAYMKLSILEMEKFRRGKERQSAMERVQKIDQRFLDIEAARQEIFSAMEAQGIRRPIPGPRGLEEPKAAPRSTTGPFKIRY